MWKCHNCNKKMECESMFCDSCEEKEYIHCELCGKITNKHHYSNEIGGMVCLEGCNNEDIFRNRPYLKTNYPSI